MISNVNEESTAADYKKYIDLWLNSMPKGVHANWVLGNHDNHRLASRLGVARGDLINIMLNTLPGIAITYQGEELVMENVYLTYTETLDPAACNTKDPIGYEKFSRDGCRTPFPWDNTLMAGFTTGSKTWLPIKGSNLVTNVKDQEEADNSHLKIYKKLLLLRKKDVMRQGTYNGILLNSDTVLAYKRELGTEVVVVALNYGSTKATVNLKQAFEGIPSNLAVYTSSLGSQIVDG